MYIMVLNALSVYIGPLNIKSSLVQKSAPRSVTRTKTLCEVTSPWKSTGPGRPTFTRKFSGFMSKQYRPRSTSLSMALKAWSRASYCFCRDRVLSKYPYRS